MKTIRKMEIVNEEGTFWSLDTIADFLGVHRNTVKNKIRGNDCFTPIKQRYKGSIYVKIPEAITELISVRYLKGIDARNRMITRLQSKVSSLREQLDGFYSELETPEPQERKTCLEMAIEYFNGCEIK